VRFDIEQCGPFRGGWVPSEFAGWPGSLVDPALSCMFVHTKPQIEELLIEERRRALLDTLARDGRVHAATAAEHFGVSEDSIRRDLRHFDQLGLMKRVRGGAVRRVPGSSASARLAQATAGHVACARALAERLQTHGRVVALDNGSTAVWIAQHLVAREGLTVVTGNAAAATAAWANGVQLVLLGGYVDATVGGVIESSAIEAMRGMRVDIAVLGACGVVGGVGVVTDAPGEASFKRALVASAGEVWVAADAAKIGAAGAFVVAGLDTIDVLATDADESGIGQLGLSDRTEVIRVDADRSLLSASAEHLDPSEMTRND
jgi:DeoR/GlpR family transcriptional regulator of sugar metabolism